MKFGSWLRLKLLSFFAVVLVVGGLPAPVLADTPPLDVNAPEVAMNLTSISNTQAKTLIYRANLSDNRYVQSATCQILLGAASSSEVPFRKVSGNRTWGTWECRIPLTRGTEVGSWKTKLVVLDSGGNLSTYKALTSSLYEFTSTNENSVPALRTLSGGVLNVEDSSQRGNQITIDQPFSLIGEFGVGGYAEVWPPTLTGKTLAVQWFADGMPMVNSVGTRIELAEDLAGKKLSARVVISANGFRNKVVHLVGTYPVGQSIADTNGSAGWIYQDGV
ncbi:MAG: hypothetical protein RL166_1104, partial [Actinomycetota bacterium]